MPHLPVVGQNMWAVDQPAVRFDDCPAYYLRTARMGLPAEHLLDDGTHVGLLVADWAHEVESGSRPIGTLSTKGRDGVNLYLHERASRERTLSEMRREKHGRK